MHPHEELIEDLPLSQVPDWWLLSGLSLGLFSVEIKCHTLAQVKNIPMGLTVIHVRQWVPSTLESAEHNFPRHPWEVSREHCTAPLEV